MGSKLHISPYLLNHEGDSCRRVGCPKPYSLAKFRYSTRQILQKQPPSPLMIDKVGAKLSSCCAIQIRFEIISFEIISFSVYQNKMSL